MTGTGYWVIRTYECGPVGEKTKYWVAAERTPKSRRRLRAELAKQAQNEYSATKTVNRLLNLNWPRGNGALIGLDYSDEGLEKLTARAGTEDMDELRAAAERELANALRRVKRELAKEGRALHTVAITSDMDGKTGEVVRLHHHIVTDRETAEIFRRKWKLGGVYTRQLEDEADHWALAEYLMGQVRKLPDAKKYKCSRNLARPEPKDRIAKSGAELRAPAGAALLYRSGYRPGQPQYIRYEIAPGGEFPDTTTRTRGRETNSAREQISGDGASLVPLAGDGGSSRLVPGGGRDRGAHLQARGL